MTKPSTVPYAHEPGLIARLLGVALEAVNPSTSVKNSVFVPRVWAREHEWGNEQYTYRKFVMRRCRTMSCFLPGVPAIVHADPRKLTLSDILSYRVVAEVITPRVSGRDQTPAETGKWCTYDTVGILYASRSLTFDDTAVASTSGFWCLSLSSERGYVANRPCITSDKQLRATFDSNTLTSYLT